MFGWLRRVRGFSTPFGGISWGPPTEKPFGVPEFNGTIALTSKENDDVIAFLEKHAGLIVYLNATIDACVATEEQAEFVDSQDLDFGLIESGTFGDKRYELRNNIGKLAYITFTLLPANRRKVSFGGTGVVTLAVRGFFEVVQTAHAGPSLIFHLTENDAPLSAKIEKTNR
ncbi:MAG: hypothetical protein VYE29_04715 [Pseudomonadota bacterium]|nr:hypothetical protein [Pseudomonadota bacterium]